MRALSNAARAGRAGPPLLFGLAPRGVFRAPGITAGAVGSYPTFSPLPNALRRNRPAPGFTGSLPPRPKLTGGLFSVALSVVVLCGALVRIAKTGPLTLSGASPLVPRPLPAEEPGVRTFLPSLRGLAADENGRRSPGSSAVLIIRASRHPRKPWPGFSRSVIGDVSFGISLKSARFFSIRNQNFIDAEEVRSISNRGFSIRNCPLFASRNFAFPPIKNKRW